MTRNILIDEGEIRFVEDGFRSGLPVHSGIEGHLRGVMTDTLSHPGSLARAQIAFSLMKVLGFDEKISRDVGVAIEYFHTASLLFDDLPCMDNATNRRGHACPHVVHGEAPAILGALALINQGYALLWNVLGKLPEQHRQAAGELLNECLGINGILNGQSRDLYFRESARDREDILQVARGKTVMLIRLTLLLPGLISGADQKILNALEALSVSWGLAYQILDDFKDYLMNETETGKTTLRDQQLDHPNLPVTMGAKEALAELDRRLEVSRVAILNLQSLIQNTTVLERLQSIFDSSRAEIQASPRFSIAVPAKPAA